jgi:flavoprotein
MRDIDVDDTEKLRIMKGISVIDSPSEIKMIVERYLKREKAR